MGNFQIPNTNIKLINYSICPKCRHIFSFKDLIDYYLKFRSPSPYPSKMMHRCKHMFHPRCVSVRVLQFSEKCRRESILIAEEKINREKVNQRDILEYGMRFVVDGTDSSVIDKILSNIIAQKDDKYTRQMMLVKKEAVLMIQEDFYH